MWPGLLTGARLKNFADLEHFGIRTAQKHPHLAQFSEPTLQLGDYRSAVQKTQTSRMVVCTRTTESHDPQAPFLGQLAIPLGGT
jgi:hypothetical protein